MPAIFKEAGRYPQILKLEIASIDFHVLLSVFYTE